MAKVKIPVQINEVEVVEEVVVEATVDTSADVLAEIVKQNESQAGYGSRDTKNKLN